MYSSIYACKCSAWWCMPISHPLNPMMALCRSGKFAPFFPEGICFSFENSFLRGPYPVHSSVLIGASGAMADFINTPNSLALLLGITLPYNRLMPFPFLSTAKTTIFFLTFFLPTTPSYWPPTTVSSTSAFPSILWLPLLFMASMTLRLNNQHVFCLNPNFRLNSVLEIPLLFVLM
ncbi:hypothetical protein BH23BAC1_BH23BAC1_12990 [soil metagenome]